MYVTENFLGYEGLRGKAIANYPQELAQDAVCQSHTGHMTGLWFLPTQPLRLNTNELMKCLQTTVAGDGTQIYRQRLPLL